MDDSQPVALTEDQISRKALAHILPIALFMGLLLVIPILEFFGFLFTFFLEFIYLWDLMLICFLNSLFLLLTLH